MEKSNCLADPQKSSHFFVFVSVKTSNFIYALYKDLDIYSLKMKLLYFRQVFFLVGKLNHLADEDNRVAAFIANLSCLSVAGAVRTVLNVLYSKL